MTTLVEKIKKTVSPEQFFMASALLVNGGNYLYNLFLGRYLGPQAFADAAIVITLLLVLSFIAMTFQLVVAKYTVLLEGDSYDSFFNICFSYTLLIGMLIGFLMVFFSLELQEFFNTQTRHIFIVFGIGVPFYFIMSLNRGRLQGRSSFIELSFTYQIEMIVRFLGTFLLLNLFNLNASFAVTIALFFSFISGIFPFSKKGFKLELKTVLSKTDQLQIIKFFMLTAGYEFTQILCNNSDILLIKHYFNDTESGLYASLALIGRVVYFITWMLVMLLLPKVVAKKKQGLETHSILLKYISYTLIVSLSLTIFTFLFPEFTVKVLFGKEYMQIAPLLGWYALATSCFAIANLFAYYFISLTIFVPVILTAICGLLQIALIIFFHDSLFEVVLMQIIAMVLLLLLQLGYYKIFHKTSQ